jgi:hypothetical protein
MIDILNIPHDRHHVRLLHQAHADHIEASYRGLLALPANPYRVIIKTFNQTRTFMAEGYRLENRAIFTGEETPDEIDAVLAHFEINDTNLVIEVNPANFYVNPPATWEKRLLNHLLLRGCIIHNFRCVWCRTKPLTSAEISPSARIERFDSNQLDDYIALASKVEEKTDFNLQARAQNQIPGKFHYVVFNDAGHPEAVGGMFISNETAYLSWWFTHPSARKKGHQLAGILRRVQDAFAMGCRRVFTVTDFNFSSPANPQRAGLTLAYNYLLVRKDPVPL